MSQPKPAPVVQVAVASMIAVITGGIYMAAQLPRRPPLGVGATMLGIGGGLTLVAVLLLARLRPFAWGAFFTVARWALLAYLVITGLPASVFILDGTKGAVLAVMSLMLIVFAVDVPMVIGFTVARYQPAEGTGASLP